MEPSIDSFLSTSAEVGVGVIGFTGVVVALLGTKRESYLGFEFSTLFMTAGGLIVFALIPYFLIAADVGDVWWYSSCVFLCWFFPLMSIRAVQARRVAPDVPRDLPSVLFGLTSVFGLVAAGLQVYNLFESQAWRYIALIGMLVIVSIVSFGVLLFRVWRGEADV